MVIEHHKFNAHKMTCAHIGITHDSISINGLLYIMTVGVIDLSPAKQPFLNEINYLPLEVPPSAQMIRGGQIPFSAWIYLSKVILTTSLLSSFTALSKYMQPVYFPIGPIIGMFSISALTTALGICLQP
jgi:hypothetical protein